MLYETFRKYGQAPFKIVLIHGGPGAAGELYPLALELSKNTGIIELLQTKKSIQSLLYEMLHHINELCDKPVFLVGHSWGGMLASGYLGYAPEKVAKAVMAEPGFLNAQEQKDWQEYLLVII